MPIDFPPLPYETNSLEPSISRRTLEFHHGKHHKKYVSKLNELIKNTPLDTMDLVSIIIESAQSNESIFNNAAQAWNHNFYWHCLSPNGETQLSGEFKNKIAQDFGSFENFRNQFEESAKKLFGSGWTWLVCDKDGKLSVFNSKDADNPIVHDLVPLLTCDVWEHAYYLDYQNERPAYLKNYWTIIDWSFVEKNWRQSQSQYSTQNVEHEQPSQLH